MGAGEEIEVVQPHAHRKVLGTCATPPTADAEAAVDAAQAAAPGWRALSFDDRAAILLKAADLLAGPWRAAAQRRDDARPVQDRLPGRDRRRLRADRLLAVQRPLRPADPRRAADRQRPGIWNRTDHRPLEGFVYAITPFNFTAIAGNLPTAPALMGNTVVWKPSPTQQLAAHADRCSCSRRPACRRASSTWCTGDGLDVSEVALADPRPRRHPLHRLDRRPSSTCGATVGDEHRELPLLPAARRRDRRQGLRRRPPVGRPRRAAHRADPRRLRVPGPEVLGRLAGLRRRARCGRRCATTSSPRPRRSPWATSPTSPTSWARSSTTARSPSTRPRSTAPSAHRRLDGRRRRHVRRLGGLLRPARRSSSRTDPTDEIVHAPSTSARSSPCTSTTTPTTSRSLDADGVASRRTR